MEISEGDILLCTFFFSDLKSFKKRPVLVFKVNLPFNDFIAIPISSKIDKLHSDENLLTSDDFEVGGIPQSSKLMLRKTFVVSRDIVVKKYGSLSNKSLKKYHEGFCRYFQCSHN